MASRDADDRRDHWVQRSLTTFLQVVLTALAIWIGASVESLRETSTLNTYKITQIQTTIAPMPTLATQVAKIQLQVDSLEQRQAKDDAFREMRTNDKGLR